MPAAAFDRCSPASAGLHFRHWDGRTDNKNNRIACAGGIFHAQHRQGRNRSSFACPVPGPVDDPRPASDKLTASRPSSQAKALRAVGRTDLNVWPAVSIAGNQTHGFNQPDRIRALGLSFERSGESRGQHRQRLRRRRTESRTARAKRGGRERTASLRKYIEQARKYIQQQHIHGEQNRRPTLAACSLPPPGGNR